VFDVSATKNALNSEDAPILPSWVWAVILFSAISWFMKGEEVKFTFPTTFKSWLLLTFLVGLIAVFNAASFPWWIALPFYWGIFTVGDVLEVLATKGRENYLKLTDNGNESD
jgi:hypothetical protein